MKGLVGLVEATLKFRTMVNLKSYLQRAPDRPSFQVNRTTVTRWMAPSGSYPPHTSRLESHRCRV